MFKRRSGVAGSGSALDSVSKTRDDDNGRNLGEELDIGLGKGKEKGKGIDHTHIITYARMPHTTLAALDE